MSLFNQGQAAFQPESLTPARIGFSPVSVRFANLAPQDATTWNSAAGTATITTGITAPDSTTYAATLACPTNDRAYRRIYSTERTVCIGDWLMCGVYVKAGMLTQGANQPTSTMANFAAATLRILDDTEGYQIDIDGLNYRNLTASEDADTTWQWITTAAKIELAPSGDSATVALDLNCDPDHAVSFYAPTLWHIPANTLTDAEVQAQLLNFYPVPDAAEAGIVATLAGQSFQSKIRDAGGQVFNVRASGAIGDGVTDDTLAIQSALDKAATTVGKTYRTVFVPAGNWKVSGLILTGNVRLIGAGDGETLLSSTDNAPIINCQSSDFEMPVVEKLRIRGSVDAGSNQIGLKVDDPLYGLRAAVRDVWIENCGGDGLYVGLAFSSIFENIFATNCAGYPFHYNAPNMPGNVFLSCYAGNVRDTAPVGFRIRAGEAILKGCNGINSLNPGSKWAVVGKKSGVDGDTAHAGAVLDLEDCNLESYIDSGILAYSFSFINLRGNTTFVGQALSTTLNGGINNSVTTLTVASTQYFSNAGTIEIDSERITYTGKTSTTLTGCTRGVHGTSAASHSNGATVKFLKKPIEWEHINEGTDYFAHTLARGIIEDSVRFTDGQLTNYVRNEAIHCNGFPPLQTIGRGARVVSGDPLSTYWNSNTGASAKLSRADSYLSKLTITGTTSITQPGVQYIEINHSGATTLTLPWPALYTLGDLIIIKDVSSAGAATNNILLNANSGGTVNGSSYTLNINGQAVVLAPDGSNDWRIVATYSQGGGVTGTGTSGRIAYWSGSSTLTSDADATFDGFNATFGRVYHSGGTGGAPGLSSSSDTGSGFYLSSAGVYGYASSAANGGAGGNVVLFAGDGVTIDGRLTLTEKTAPSTPAANSLTLYAKDKSGVSTLYYKKDDGTEIEIGSGGGGSGDVIGPSSATDNALARFDTTTGKLIQNSGLTLSDLSTSTYTLAVTAPSATSTSTAGYSFIERASNAIAGTSTNGAAAGGDWSAIAGDAARLNTGDANGGNIYLTPGAKIGSGTDGQVILGRVGTTSVPALTWAGNGSSGISLINSGIQFSLSGSNNAAVDSNGFKASNNGRLDFSSDSTTSGTTDLALSRFAANTLRIGGDMAGSTAGKLFVSRSDKTHTGWFTLCGDSSNTNAVDNVGAIGLDSTSTTATGFGSQLLLTLESTSTNQRQAAGLTWLWTTATDASRSADLYFSTVNAGTVAEAFRVASSGAFRSAAISDPASPTNGDIWNSSARNCYSVRQSGQTEDFSTSIWRSSALSSFDTTTTATSIISDTGVGTKTIAANRLKVGNHIRITAGGLYGTKATSAGTLTVRVTNGGTTMLTAVFTLPDGVFDLVWSLEAEGAVSATGTTGTIYWRLLWLMSDASGVAYAMSYTTNSTTINTTTNRAMDVTGQFSVSSADNYFQTDNASIEILA